MNDSANNNGVVSVACQLSVSDAADKLEALISEKGMKVVARVNHAAAASSIGQELRPTELLIFGNPQAGTPLMQSQQTMALDLPQKMLVWEDANSQVWVSHNDPAYLAQRHGIDDCNELVEKTATALANLSASISS